MARGGGFWVEALRFQGAMWRWGDGRGVCVLIKRHIFRRRFMAAISMVRPCLPRIRNPDSRMPVLDFLAVIAFHVNLERHLRSPLTELLMQMQRVPCPLPPPSLHITLQIFTQIFPPIVHGVLVSDRKQLALATEMTPIGNGNGNGSG